MRPVLFEVMGVEVPAYGATLVAVWVIGLLLLRRQVRRLGVTDDHMLEIAALCAGTVLVWVLLGQGLTAAGLRRGATLNSLPVLALGAFALLMYLRARSLPAEAIFDAIAPLAAAALALQYGVGTFLAGTAFGTPTDLPWGVSFPPGSEAYRIYGSAPLHPVQLYLALLLGAVALAAASWPRSEVPGRRALATFVAIASVYLGLSPLRGNTHSLLAGQAPRLSELVAIFIVVFCLYQWTSLARR